MPLNVRKDGRAKRVALDILGPPLTGYVDSFGNKKRFKKKKGDKNAEGETINRFQEIGFR